MRSGADAAILDLEDSVPPAEKAAARNAIADKWPLLAPLGVPLLVRVNPETSDAWDDDLRLVRDLPGLAAVMVPKAERADTLVHMHGKVGGASMLPLIETAAGLCAVDAVAGVEGVVRLAVGHIDFMADTGIVCSADEQELAPLRFAVAIATRMQGLAPAVDGVTVQTGDEARLREDTLRARRFGFGGKLCIHPRQVAAVHQAFAPSAEEVAWARRVIEADAAAGGAAVALDDRMVDRPVVLQAQRTLARANR